MDAMAKMKCRKSTELHDVTVDNYDKGSKRDGKAVIEWLVRLCCAWYHTGKVPGDLKKACRPTYCTDL